MVLSWSINVLIHNGSHSRDLQLDRCLLSVRGPFIVDDNDELHSKSSQTKQGTHTHKNSQMINKHTMDQNRPAYL